jgi:16S rRNA (guanine(966)-N(2))-methyltransferase RsmD
MAPRVISGKAKGRRLKLVPGHSTRPIMDRVKESLFNILGDVNGTRWLDLFAGTGQVGIEALSRGAAEAVFVDNTRAATQTIRDNLDHTRLTTGATVVQSDAFRFLDKWDGGPFDVVYVAPPQYRELWIKALTAIDAGLFLSSDGMVIVQIDPREFREMPLSFLALVDKRRYGNTLLCFYAAQKIEK